MQLTRQQSADWSSCFTDTLRYCSPSHGGWGVVRTGMLVPESYQLFVCPFACGRHGAIGAIAQGFKHRLSYLYIDEADIVSGGYEQLIGEAVDELLKALDFKPKVLMIFVSCLDDLLGTDHNAFLHLLRSRHRDMRFTVCHMNPITLDSKLPPPVNIQRKIYGLLEVSAKPKLKHAAAFYGNNVSIEKGSEVYEVLAAAGYTETYHISECRTYAEFQKLAQASINIVPTPVGLAAAAEVKEAHGIDYVYAPVSYDFAEIEQNYEQILARFQMEMDLSKPRQDAISAILRAKAGVGNLPVIIDSSATIRPFSLAKLLCSFGFKVEKVYAQQCIPIEMKNYLWLAENAPGVKIIQPEHPRSPVVRKYDRECLAIGFEGAYLTGARFIVDLVNDETLYGYKGIERLMQRLVSASQASSDLRSLLNRYGLVI
ncbi:MAG: nitrogenase component 1 [Syntrophomonadaceae bacterium]|nr:nitrogenase component 1 [Syntrophomonadaceae bacterium]